MSKRASKTWIVAPAVLAAAALLVAAGPARRTRPSQLRQMASQQLESLNLPWRDVRPGLPGRPQQEPPTVPCTNGVQPLTVDEVQALLLAGAQAVDDPRLTIAVVDRPGNVLGRYRKAMSDSNRDDRAAGLARTGAFFSNNQAPLSSRTVRTISGAHFPPGVERTPNAALYGIENTNRGCDLGLPFRPGREIAPARSPLGGLCLAGGPVDGCGSGPVTGKIQPLDGPAPGDPPTRDPRNVPVDPGGLPVFRGNVLVGGIGVAADDGRHAEFAALTAVLVAGFTPFPDPLPPPGQVFIDGIRLPFVAQTDQPPGTAPDPQPPGGLVGLVVGGRCAPEGWLSGPRAGNSLDATEVERIVDQAVAAAQRTRAVIRLPLGSRARMVIAVGDRDGEILGLFRMPDATVFSIDVAVAKARNVAHFSRVGLPGVPPGTAVTNRTIGFGAQPLFPPGIDGTAPGPFFDLFLSDLANPCQEGGSGANRNGVVFFAGSIPLYRGRELVGGLGISGDGVEQDDFVAFHGATGFRPPEDLQADRIRIDGVRLPFLKLPRNPEE